MGCSSQQTSGRRCVCLARRAGGRLGASEWSLGPRASDAPRRGARGAMVGFSGALFAWNGYACGVSLFGFTVSLPHGPVDSRPALQAMAEAIRTNQLQTPVIEPERAGFALARLSDARAPRRGALVDR